MKLLTFAAKIMKQRIFIFVLFIGCTMAARASVADYSYRHSMGGSVGSFFAAQYKAFIFPRTPHAALVTDLGFNLIASRLGSRKLGYTQAEFWVAQLNPNIVYQSVFAANEGGSHSWFIGGGTSIGMLTGYADHSLINGKGGVNAMIGYEWSCSRIPLVIALDFRPGYGFTFREQFGQSFFDWSIAMAIRKRF